MSALLGKILSTLCPAPLYQNWLHYRYPMRRKLKTTFADRYVYHGQDGADLLAQTLQQGRDLAW